MTVNLPADDFVVGIDLGGSTLRGVVVSTSAPGAARAEAQRSFDSREGDPIAEIAQFVRGLVAEADVSWGLVSAVGIGVAGSVHDGVVSLATNIPTVAELRLGDSLNQVLDRPIIVDNDVNMAALGEWGALGEQAGQHLAFLSVGTGVGLGIVAAGELLRGAHGEAGEIGFLPTSTESGLTVEDLAGGAALARRFEAVTAMAGPISGRDVLDLADGDDAACEIAESQYAALALAVVAVRYILDPDLIVIGGGIGLRPGFVDNLRRHVRGRLDPGLDLLRESVLAERAGAIGAAQAARLASVARPATPARLPGHVPVRS